MTSLSLKNKKGNVIHRTTSETLRLGDDLLYSNHSQAKNQNTNARKKAATSPSCSFQITGVLTRYDLEDESADESHTDDISRVTDNETPSFSEDSRDTDEHQIQQAAPNQNQCLTGDLNVADSKFEEKEKPIFNNNLGRFTVVKMESIAPFSRGRWTCFDYIDDFSRGLHKIFGQDQNLATCNTSVSYIDIGIADRKLSYPYWDANCQQPYTYTGSIIMPQPIPIYVPVCSRSQKNKKISCPLSQNILPMFITPKSVEIINNSANVNAVINGNQEQNFECKNVPEILDNHVYKSSFGSNVGEGMEIAKQTSDNNNSGASVACTTTIDTKIEHALDVVKNHLTQAVRIEVEELKIKINELVERISYLEYENDLLRANVAPDVLNSLNNTQAK